MNSTIVNPVYVIGESAGFSQPANAEATNASEVPRRRIKQTAQQPIVDVIVVLVALPALTILALLLEANTRGPWLETAKSRYTVLGLGFALATVCLSICIYITSRLGGKMWSGAIPADGSGPHYSYYSSRLTVNDANDKPPSYDVVMGFDIPPPPYHTIIIEHDTKDVVYELECCSKLNAIQHM